MKKPIQDRAQSVGNVINELFRSLGIQPTLEKYKVFDQWNEIVGEQIARVAKPERIVQSTLIVTVSNAPWRAELTFRKKELLEKIHTATASTALNDITFR